MTTRQVRRTESRRRPIALGRNTPHPPAAAPEHELDALIQQADRIAGQPRVPTNETRSRRFT